MHLMRPFMTLCALTLALLATTGAAQPREREIVQYENVSIETIVEGDGPLLVLLPSLGRDSEEFDALAAAVARSGFRVLRPRPRGFGRSVGPMDKLTLRDFAADIAAVIKSQNAGPAIVAGHAYGHFIAKMTATEYPDVVRGVALVAAAQKNIDPKVRGWLAIATDPKQPETERIKYLQMVFFAPGHDPRAWLTGFDPAVQKAQEVARDSTPQATYWSSGTAPLLDLQAEHDPYRPRSTKDQLIDEFGADRVSVVVIADASHALPVEQPDATANALVSWAKALK
jgi:pimeloyl-ACP methyl ester carboxylesterase